MFNEANHTSGKSLQYVFGGVEVHFYPDQLYKTSVTKRLRNKAGLGSGDAAKESAVLSGALAAAYERVVQALRDVRHLLPADGVAIVDAVLDSIEVT